MFVATVISFVFGVIAIEVWPTQMPVWALVLALLIGEFFLPPCTYGTASNTPLINPAFVYIIPIGMIQAITNQQVGLNVITELIIGYALPGRPVAMMMFKVSNFPHHHLSK
jgi:hypothetical protein